MGRFRTQTSYGHSIKRLEPDWYRMGWAVDYYYPDSRLRFPRSFERDTDEVGAKRFCKKHGIDFEGKFGGNAQEATQPPQVSEPSGMSPEVERAFRDAMSKHEADIDYLADR